jgi:phage gpG-like protein
VADLKIKIEGSEGVRSLALGFERFGKILEDMVPFLEAVLVALENNADRLFDSQGSSGSGKWAPLSPVTEIIRSEQGFGGLPILENTGLLRNALGRARGRGALRLTQREGRGGVLIYGTNGVHYASFHQTGTKQRGVTPKQQAFLRVAFGIHMKLGHVITMPARPPIDFTSEEKMTPALRKEIRNAAYKFLKEAAGQVAAYGGLRGNRSAWEQFERDFSTGGRFDGE